MRTLFIALMAIGALAVLVAASPALDELNKSSQAQSTPATVTISESPEHAPAHLGWRWQELTIYR